jgi:hypothetical protein
MLLRDMPLTVVALEERILITCSCPITPSTAGGVGGVGISSTANSIVSSSAGTTGTPGRIIDRRGDDITLSRYQVAIPQAFLQSTRGSTEANRQLTLGIRLQHGDSSGGGDMADYSTANAPADRVLFSTARTSEMQVWSTAYSTGVIPGLSTLPAYYDLRGAKRFIRAVVYAQKSNQTTETSGDEGARVHATITFAAGDQAPQGAKTTEGWSTSTSTST